MEFALGEIPFSTYNVKKLIFENGIATLEQSRYAQYILELVKLMGIREFWYLAWSKINKKQKKYSMTAVRVNFRSICYEIKERRL